MLAPSDRAGGLHAGLGMGEGPGREPGRQSARPAVPSQAAGEEPRRAECVAGRSVHRLRQANQAPGVQGADDLGGVPGRTREPDGAARALRRLRREGGQGQHHLPDHGRSQPLQRRCAGRRPDGAGALPCRTHRRAAGRRGGRRPPAPVPARPDHLRSLALPAGSDEEARRLAQRRPVQGLGSAARA